MADPREETLRAFSEDRWLAHSVLFRKRHPLEPCEAHRELVARVHSPEPRYSFEGFRGLAKTTFLEEAVILRAGFREFRYGVVVSANYRPLAIQRIAAMKREFELNRDLIRVFGELKGNTWQEGLIVLSNGVAIQAIGRDMSVTGMKYLDHRPDALFIDDVEDPDEVRTDHERKATWDWFQKTLLPALDHPLYSWIRALGQRRGSGSLPERFEKNGWPVYRVPVEYVDEEGQRQPTWEAKFTLREIDRMRHDYRGDMHLYMQEYMCEPTSAADRVFRPEMFRVEPRERRWEAVYAMVDPARTTNKTSATTGWAVWSWIGNRLIVWAAGAESFKPDEIIELCFQISERWNPVWIGIEEDGLNEWVRQPLRHEQSKRHTTIPVKPIRAPRNKHAFIGGLQAYFAAEEVIFAHPMPELEAQLLSFPLGKIDAPNALAYALPMRPAAPIYDGFGPEHIAADLGPDTARPLYLAANATRTIVTAALAQLIDGQLRVLADWIIEGAVEEIVPELHAEAGLWRPSIEREVQPKRRDWTEMLKVPERRLELSRLPLKWIIPPSHMDRWNNVGLSQAIGRIPATASRGSAELVGREFVRGLLSRLHRGGPAVVISDRAGWTLRSLAGGYTRTVVKGGGLSDDAEPGPYRLLMEGIESFAGMMSRAEQQDVDGSGNWAEDKSGRRYLSAMPQR